MSEEKSKQEIAAEKKLLEQLAAGNTGEYDADTISSALLDLVKTRGAREGIDQERQKSLTDIIDAFGKAMKSSSPTQERSAPPGQASSASNQQFGLRPKEEISAEIKELQKQSQTMRRVLESMIPIVSNIKRDTKLADAADVLKRVNDALTNMSQASLQVGGISTSRFHQPHLSLGDVHKDLQDVETVDAMNRIRNDRLYPALLQIRQIFLEGHAMLAWPAPGKISNRPDANLVTVLGSEATKNRLLPVLKNLGLSMLVTRTGSDKARNRWEDMQRGYLVIADFNQDDMNLRASIAYQTGWARALGRPLVILNEDGQTLPFDIDIEPTDINNAIEIESAISDSLYAPSQSGKNRAASKRTVEELIRLFALHPDTSVRVSTDFLVQEKDNLDDGAIFDKIRSLLAFVPPNEKPELITPEWPPLYPEPGKTRMFHVMPFHSGWPDSVMEEAKRAAKSVYRRHDHVESEHIIRTLWEEIASASHILVDISELNDNVMIELGMAHVLGKNTRIVAQDSVDLNLLPDLVRNWRVWQYSLRNLKSLSKIVKDFISTGSD